ncbi:MAG: polysaccharide export protein [Deltaproteobacteria bacterium]|nr:MAG: polysaccharide export protein [Deltaproteobacteria bacterium]
MKRAQSMRQEVRQHRRLLFVTLSLLLYCVAMLTGCPGPSKQVRNANNEPDFQKPIITKQSSYKYKQLLTSFLLDVGDVISIKVYGEPNLRGTFQIYPNCEIQFPLIKKVDVCGRTPGQIRTDIATRLHEKYFQARPSVSVKVQQYNSKKVHVLGQVSRSGRFSFNPGMTVVQAIAMAGGFTNQAAPADTRLVRSVGGKQRVYRINLDGLGTKRIPDIYLRPGDVIIVKKSWL